MVHSFSEWLLLREARTGKILVYHGTSPKNFRSIMSQGLVPDHPKRAWSKDDQTSFLSSSRKSLEGVYVTTNLALALSAASNGSNDHRDGKLLIVAEVQPKTGFMDEDDLNRFSVVSESEYIISALYGAINSNPKSEFVQETFQKFRMKFGNKLADAKGTNHPQLMRRIEPLIWQLFLKAITRQAAYVDDWTFRKAHDYKPNLQKPNKAVAERDFLRVKELLTQSLKKMANPFNYDSLPYIFTSRLMEPIGFSGANRILAIIYEPVDYKQPPEIWYGNVPEQVVSDWTKSIGNWEPIRRNQ